ncbi:hypothetical protein VTK26DRAFT_1003 [Humicola hyalothermophila]
MRRCAHRAWYARMSSSSGVYGGSLADDVGYAWVAPHASSAGRDATAPVKPWDSPIAKERTLGKRSLVQFSRAGGEMGRPVRSCVGCDEEKLSGRPRESLRPELCSTAERASYPSTANPIGTTHPLNHPFVPRGDDGRPETVSLPTRACKDCIHRCRNPTLHLSLNCGGQARRRLR